MADTLTLYTNPFSRGRMARWMLEEIGQPYEVELIRFDTRQHKAPEFLAINPMGKLPTLVHGDTVVTETAAICAYLADAFPDAGLAPPSGDPARGPYYRWLFFAAGCIEQAAMDKALDREVPEKRGSIGYGTYSDVLDTLEGLVQGTTWVAGDTFTAADLYLASQLAYGMRFETIEKRPAFEAYVGRALARPAFARATEADDALVAQLKAEG